MGINDLLNQYLLQKQSQGLYRTRQLTLPDLSILDFSCNDYLSLNEDETLKEAYQAAFGQYPAGSGGSMVLCGYQMPHLLLEQEFAQALGVDDCLLFSSGYVANLAVVSLLAQFGARFVIDKAVHASVYDGLMLAKAPFTRFSHNNLSDLAQKLQESTDPTVVLTESIFSMSGQQAPLAEISAMVRASGCTLVVDEAHGFGILGAEGMGGVNAAGLTQVDVPLRVIPFGKALSGSGSIVAGQAVWIDALLQATRQPIYSTAISPAYAEGMRQALVLLRAADDRRAHLKALIAYFNEKIASSALVWRCSSSPIQQLQLGSPHLATAYAEKLMSQGIRCFAIRQPTVPKQETGLRVILNVHHTFEDIDRLFETLHA